MGDSFLLVLSNAPVRWFGFSLTCSIFSGALLRELHFQLEFGHFEIKNGDQTA